MLIRRLKFVRCGLVSSMAPWRACSLGKAAQGRGHAGAMIAPGADSTWASRDYAEPWIKQKAPGQRTPGLGSVRMRSVLGHDRGLALAPAEAPVDAEFDDVDVLGDVSMEDPAAHRRNREGDVAAPEAVEVVLE